MIAERERGRLPREPPRETDFAAERPKGDGFRLVSVSLARFRGTPVGKLPRGCPRATPPAAKCPEGERPHLRVSPSRASVTSRRASCRGTPRGRRILPRGIPRATDFARFPSPSPRGRRPPPAPGPPRMLSRHPPLSRRLTTRPPSTQKTRLERRAFNTKLCSRTRAYRLSASTGQEEMQAPHSMHSSSLTSA